MSYISAPKNLYELIYELHTNGYEVIVAHPERYRFLHNNFSEYMKLKKIGCKLQINLLSCTGYYGKDISTICNKLLKNNLVDFVGSDIHNFSHIKHFKDKINISEIKKLETAISNNSILR